MRAKIIVLVVALAALLMIAAGCGTTSSKTEPSNDEGAKGSAAPPSATVGSTLQLKGIDEEITVKLVATKRLPAASAYGEEMHPALYGVKLTVTNIGENVYDDSISNCVVLIDAKDQSHNPESCVADANMNILPGQLESVKIRTGDKRTGWVFFPLKKTEKPRAFQFTPSSGCGEEVGEWLLKK